MEPATQLIISICSLVGVVFTGLVGAYVALRQNETKKTIDSVHVLVNSSMSAQLKISMLALHRVAVLEPTAENQEAATLAERLYHDHEAKQSVVDKTN